MRIYEIDSREIVDLKYWIYKSCRVTEVLSQVISLLETVKNMFMGVKIYITISKNIYCIQFWIDFFVFVLMIILILTNLKYET